MSMDSIAMKKHYAKLRSAGLCVKCRKPRDGSSNWRCKACLKKMVDRARERSKGFTYDGG
jgi:hypothetical protein